MKFKSSFSVNRKQQNTVNRVQANNIKKRVRKTPCWFCGGMRYAYIANVWDTKNVIVILVSRPRIKIINQKNLGKKTKNNNIERDTNRINSIFVTKQIKVTKRKYICVQINDFSINLQFDTASAEVSKQRSATCYITPIQDFNVMGSQHSTAKQSTPFATKSTREHTKIRKYRLMYVFLRIFHC